AVAVLAQPQGAAAGAKAPGEEGVGQLVHAVVHFGVGETEVAAHQGVALRVAATVLPEDVAEGQGMERIHGSEENRALMPVIDADTHLYEPRDMWAHYADPGGRDKTLRVADDDLGHAWLMFGDRKIALA